MACFLHELPQYGSQEFVWIYNIFHILDIETAFFLHEQISNVYSSQIDEQMPFHIGNKFDLVFLHELI